MQEKSLADGVEVAKPRNVYSQQFDSDGKRGLLVFVSMAIAVAAYGVMAPAFDYKDIASNYSSFDIQRFLWSALIGISYPVVGAIVVKLCALLRKVAYLGEVEPWSKDTVIWLALAWPITMLISMFVYPCLFFVNLLF